MLWPTRSRLPTHALQTFINRLRQKHPHTFLSLLTLFTLCTFVHSKCTLTWHGWLRVRREHLTSCIQVWRLESSLKCVLNCCASNSGAGLKYYKERSGWCLLSERSLCWDVFKKMWRNAGTLKSSYLRDLNLKGGVWVSEVRLVVLDGLVPPVEAVPAAVAVPVCSFESLLAFNGAHDLTVVTAAQHLQACEVQYQRKLVNHTHFFNAKVCFLNPFNPVSALYSMTTNTLFRINAGTGKNWKSARTGGEMRHEKWKQMCVGRYGSELELGMLSWKCSCRLMAETNETLGLGHEQK